MNLQNGYKKIYEIAANGSRTFYASKTGFCDTSVDKELASFTDSDYAGKTLYEYKGKFYISTGAHPAYDEEGIPTDTCLIAFDEVFMKAESEESTEAKDVSETPTVLEDKISEEEVVSEDTPVSNEEDPVTEEEIPETIG